MRLLLLLGLFVSAVVGTPPTCAVLFLGDGTGCGGSESTVWLNAAQTEATRFFHTANGGWLSAACSADNKQHRIEPLDINYKHTFCLHPTDPNDIPEEKCHTKHCNFDDHPELSTGDCDDANGVPNPDGQACRSLESWIKIATEKLALALDYQEQCDFAKAVSYACVAELLFSHINEWIAALKPASERVFANADARTYHHYKHINSKLRNATYTEVDAIAQLRGWQSLRFCKKRENNSLKRSIFSALALLPGDEVELDEMHRVSSVFIFSHYDGHELDTVDESTAVQIVLAPTGLLPNFESTLGDAGLPDGRGKLCAQMNVDTTLEPIQLENRLDGLSASDWAFVRNDGEPRQTKSFSASSCSAIVLLNGIQKGVEARSIAHIQLRQAPYAKQPDEFSTQLENESFLRNAAVDECFDEDATQWFDAFGQCGGTTPTPTPTPPTPTPSPGPTPTPNPTGPTPTPSPVPTPPGGNSTDGEPSLDDFAREYGDVFVRPLAGFPVTLPPTESRCVKGPAEGEPCSIPSECGIGFSCQRLPGGTRDVAYCYDGVDFDKKRPCAFAGEDDQCPFGECFGEANGNAGGAYPLLFFFQANDCKRNPKTAVCKEPAVAGWFQYRNAEAFAEVAQKK